MRAAASCALALLLTAGASAPSDQPTTADWRIVVLGVAQDAGIPHLGCAKGVCGEVRAGRRKPERVASLGIVDRATGVALLVDATPDLPSQVHSLTGGRLPDAIFLTHAHIGHYTGLVYLGREAAGARAVPVHASRRMADFLRTNGPWSQLVSLGNIALRPFDLDAPIEAGPGLRVTPFRVPHRDEYSDTVGFRIQGPRRTVVYIPDVDRWEAWERSIRSLADEVDVVLLDGTFASAAELPGRPIEEVRHPLMSHTRELLRGTRARLLFVHLNHTNPEIDAPDVARDGIEIEI
jgi:pyrroloquinoline quinone biosynthesis protein B